LKIKLIVHRSAFKDRVWPFTSFTRKVCPPLLYNALFECQIKLFQNYFRFRQRPREIILFSARKLDWNYFKIISEDYCSSRIFPTCSMSL